MTIRKILLPALAGFLLYKLHRSNMSLKDKAADFTKTKEGLASTRPDRLKYFMFPLLVQKDESIYPYVDSAGIPTVGYGSIYNLDGTHVKMGRVYTYAECVAMFNHEFEKKWTRFNAVNKVQLSDGQVIALMSFMYNLGEGALLGSTLWRLLQSGADKQLVANEFGKWVRAGGQVVDGLVNRRADEKQIFLT